MKIQPRSLSQPQPASVSTRSLQAPQPAGPQRPQDGFRPDARALLNLHPPAPPPAPNAQLVGLERGSTNNQAVEQLQRQLIAQGVLTEAQVGNHWGTFGPKTHEAVRQFQTSQGLPATGKVDAATAAALADPRPAIDSRLRGAAGLHADELGRPTAEPVVGPDGAITQSFDNGTVTVNAQGGVHVQGAHGLDVTYEPGSNLASWQASGIYVDQMAGDPSGGNANCGFASAHMALNALGLSAPTPQEGTAGSGTYREVMELRRLGGGGTTDGNWGTAAQVLTALNASGAQAQALTNTWGSDKAAGVEAMKQAFLDPSSQEAFVVAGNPALGWPDHSTYNGGHFVTVVGYDPAKDVFIVMDPYVQEPKGPIEVSPEQLASYMTDTNAEASEIIQVTRP